MVLCMCVIFVCFVFSIFFLRARESWLRELITLPGDLCSISSTHNVAYNHLQCQSQGT